MQFAHEQTLQTSNLGVPMWFLKNFGFSIRNSSDRDSKDWGIMLFVGKYIPSNLFATENKLIEGIYVELNLQNDKWFINGFYDPHKNTIVPIATN